MRARQSINISAPASVVWDIVEEGLGEDFLHAHKKKTASYKPLEDSVSDLNWTVEKVSDQECTVCLEADMTDSSSNLDTSNNNNNNNNMDTVRTYLATLESLSGMCESIKKNVEENCQ